MIFYIIITYENIMTVVRSQLTIAPFCDTLSVRGFSTHTTHIRRHTAAFHRESIGPCEEHGIFTGRLCFSGLMVCVIISIRRFFVCKDKSQQSTNGTSTMLTRKQKEEIVQTLSAQIKESPACVLADFKGVSANDMVALKKQLRESGSTFQVIKKTLLAIALKNNNITVDTKALDGQVAISVSPDEVTAAKIIFDAAKANEHVKILGGVLGDQVMSIDQVNALAKLPTRDELRAKLLGQLQAPISGFVNTLAGVPRTFVQALAAVRDSKEA